MDLTIDNIKERWLGEGKTPFKTDEIVAGFNQVESTLGSEWLTNFTPYFGVLPSMEIVSLGLKLTVLKKGVNYESLITKLKSPTKHSLQKSFAELNAIVTVCENEQDIQFGLEPTVQGKASRPDFRVKKSSEITWTYVEVKQPDTSAQNHSLALTIQKIIGLFTNTSEFVTLEIILHNTPTDNELNLIFEACVSLSATQSPSETVLENIGVIYINHDKSNFHVIKTPSGFEGKSMLAQNYSTGNTAVTVKIASTDTRALNFFENGPDQLCPNSPGIIFIDTKNVINGMRVWPELIRKQFAEVPDVNKIVSAYIVFSKQTIIGPDFPNIEYKTTTVLNENANYKVPPWIIEKLRLTETKK
jgi:hypothetical protein